VFAIGLQIVLTLITSALLWGFTSDLTQLLIKANKDLKSTDKNRRDVATYQAGSAQLVKDLHDYRQSVTIHALIVCALFVFAAFAIWRGLGLARWLYIAAAVFFSLSGIVALEADGPKLTNALSFVVSVAAIAAMVLLILPQSALYFAATKARRLPPPPVGATPRPPGLRGLFAPPPPRQPRPGPIKPSGGRSPARTRPVTRAAGAAANPEEGTSGRGKPKVRTSPVEADATASPAAPPSAPDPSAAAARGRGKSRKVAP
jgi:hypothetical protein